jgi:FlaG/FlaF family flagellin (archaellin)
VSAVIGVILMVAITVAIAATVYIWVGGFDTGDGQGEFASATAQAENYDGDDQDEWIKITLADAGSNTPYTNSSVTVEVVAGGSVFDGVCDEPTMGSPPKCGDYFGDPAGDEWAVGSSKYFPCQDGNDHSVTVSVRDSVILDRSVDCQTTP